MMSCNTTKMSHLGRKPVFPVAPGAAGAPVPGLEPAFTVDARLGPLEDHGMTRAGHRRVVAIAGGRVVSVPGGLFAGTAGTAGGLLEAEILPGGADWQLVRP